MRVLTQQYPLRDEWWIRMLIEELLKAYKHMDARPSYYQIIASCPGVTAVRKLPNGVEFQIGALH